MKKRFLLAGCFFAIFFIVVTSIFNGARSNVTGAPASVTGSPRDGTSCISCHTPRTNFSGSGSVTSNIPVTGYIPGQTYTMTASIVRNGHVRFGFEASPQDTTAAGNFVGIMTITNSTTTQLVANNYVTHTINGTTGTNSISWSFNWKAPVTGKGPAVFYAAFNASNNNGSSSGDSIFLSSYKVYECSPPDQPGSITGNTSVCVGSPLTYLVATVSGATSYMWTLPSGWAGSSTTNSITVTPGTSGGTISVASVNGCGTSTTSTLPVTINSSNTVSVSISATSDTVCEGTRVTFTAAPTNEGTAPVYQWKLNGSIVGNNSTTYANSSLATGDKVSCILTSNLACVVQNPDTSNTITITVNPVGNATVSISASDTNVCSGQVVNFISNVVNAGSNPSFQWKKNGNNLTGDTLAIYSSTTFADGDLVSLTMASSLACASPALAVSNIVEMKVSPILVPSVTIISNSGSSVCANQLVTFNAVVNNAGTTPVYQWFKNGMALSGQTSVTYMDSLLVNGDSISLSMISSARCASPDTVSSNAIVMRIVNNATAEVSVITNVTDSICQGQNVVFTAQPVNGGTDPAYQWLKNGAPLPGDTLSTYATTKLVNGDSVSVNLTSNSVCVVTQFASSNSIGFTVVPSLRPTIIISPDSSFSICPGREVLFAASVANQGQSPVYQWTNKGINISGENSSSYAVSTLINGDIVRCILVSSAQCASPDTVLSIPDTVQTYLPTPINISQNIDTLTATQGAAYQWLVNDSSIADATGQTLVVSSNGNYTVEVTDVHGCTYLSDTVSITSLGIAGLSLSGTISIYPNPTDGVIYIEPGQNLNYASTIIKLFDHNGRLVMENHLSALNFSQIKLDIHALDNGIYLLNIRDDKNDYFARLVKQ